MLKLAITRLISKLGITKPISIKLVYRSPLIIPFFKTAICLARTI
jgi:hypothetical protein